ncbi:MAG: TetR/AcrR family transcriptional regulator [Firmicutes bacterium]|nr:TetR/AcrR family transcriptional regulator [Bacillota bacterium]
MADTTKDSIAQAAVTLFAQQGYERTSIDDIALKAGIAKGTIFYHFNSKRELFIYTVNTGMKKWLLSLARIAESPLAFPQKLGAAIDEHLRFVQEEQDLVRLLLSEGPEQRWRQEVKMLHLEYTQLMTSIIDQGKAEGSITDDLQPEVAVHTLFGAIMVLALDSLILDEGIDPSTASEQLKRLLLAGITAPRGR